MARKAIIELDVDVSNGVANIEQVENQLGDLDSVEITASADTADAEEAVENLTEEVEENTDATKKNADAQKLAKDSLIALQGPLGGFASRFTALSSIWKAFTGFVRASITSLKAFKIALLATGVGAFVVALGGALALLRKIQPVMDALERVTQAVGVTFSFLQTKLAAFLGANQDTNNSLRETIELNDRLVRQRQQLNREMVDAIVPIQKQETAIKQLRAQLREEHRSLDERASILAEIKTREEDLLEAKEYIAKRNFEIAKEQAALARNELEDDKAVAEAEAELIRVRGEAADRARTISREGLRISNELEARAKEQRAAERERMAQAIAEKQQTKLELDALRQAAEATFDAEAELNHAMAETLELLGTDLEFEPGPPLNSLAFFAEEVKRINEEILNATTDTERRRLAAMRDSYQEQADAMRESMESVDEVQKEVNKDSIEAEAARATSVKEASRGIIRSLAAEAAAAAARSVFGKVPFPLSIPLAAAAAIAANKAISALIPSFATGGSFTTDGPQLIQVGDNPGGRERVDVTPLSSPNIAGPREGNDDFRSALADVDWVFEQRTEGSTIVNVVRKTLRTQGDLGGKNAL